MSRYIECIETSVQLGSVRVSFTMFGMYLHRPRLRVLKKEQPLLVRLVGLTQQTIWSPFSGLSTSTSARRTGVFESSRMLTILRT
jgi:hypothetical protein